MMTTPQKKSGSSTPEYLTRLRGVLDSVEASKADIAKIIAELWQARDRNATVWILGNGGSQANAQHLVLHLRESRIKAFDLLADNASLTALSNDVAYERAPSITLSKIGVAGDVLFVISGSGDSANVFYAVDAALVMKISRVALLGNGGGRVVQQCNPAVVLPGLDYGPLEDAMSAIIHMISDTLKTAG